MLVKKVLNRLKNNKGEKEVNFIKEIELPSNINKWVEYYERVGKRKEFIWNWLYEMFPMVQLPLAKSKYKKSLLELKILMTMFVVQLDDAADQKNKRILLRELLKIVNKDNILLDGLNDKDIEYLNFTQKLWNYIEEQVKTYPNYKELEDVFYYDLNQVINGMDYAYLVNKNLYLINETEYWLYLPHNMTFMVYLTMDLMCSSKKNFKKIGKIREIMWESQRVGRIINWITTWQRELDDEDFTSGVFAYAIKKNILDPIDLKKLSKKEIERKIKESNIESYFLKELEISYNKIKLNSKNIAPIDVNSLLNGLEQLLFIDLASVGYK